LLEAGDVDVEGEDFSREGVLDGELFGPPNALLPGICGHRGIMGLRLVAGNCVGLRRLPMTPAPGKRKFEVEPLPTCLSI
jgi:hypothetical protein